MSLSLSLAVLALTPWPGYTDDSARLQTASFDFGIAGGGNENYYDGDFADFDLDGRPDRALLARYGLLHNRGGGVMFPVAHMRAGQAPCSGKNYTGYSFDDCQGIGNDGVQWADIDNDGDPDSLQGGNGEPFTIQTNRYARFTIKNKMSLSALNIASSDFEGDGDVDLAVAHAFCSNRNCGGPVDFRLLENDGTGRFSDVTAARGLASFQPHLIYGVLSGDMDGDLDFDLILLDGMNEEVVVALNDGAGSFTPRIAAFARPKAELLALGSGFSQTGTIGDIDDDGDLDVILSMSSNVDAPTDVPGPISLHPNVSHVIFVNDGLGNLVDDSAARWDAGGTTALLWGGNGKLVDMDHDGDLDYLSFQKSGPEFLQLYLNDGQGRFTYRPDLTAGFTFTDAGKLGADTDITDLDGDGSYDLWIGLANQKVHTLLNSYRDPIGVPADLPRDFRIDGVTASAVTLSWEAPRFAAAARHYNVYRSVAYGMADIDRVLVARVALSHHEDDSFAAPITRHTTRTGDPDVTLDPRLERVAWTDRSVVAGVSYRYSVSHVGAERSESARTAERYASVPPPAPGLDTTPPVLDLLSPGDQWWSAFPRIALAFADGESGIDPASLRVRFNVAVGGLPPGSDLSAFNSRNDGNSYLYALDAAQALPQGVATLDVSIADRAGNVAARAVTFNVSVNAPVPPTASFTATPRPGGWLVDFDASASSDADGIPMRWEWYIGDDGGRFAQGQRVSYLFTGSGLFDVTLVVRDDEGGVAVQKQSVLVQPTSPDSDGDGVGDRLDCAPTSPGAWGRPVEVTRLLAVRAGSDVRLSWDDQSAAAGTATVHDVAGGALSALRASAGTAGGCLERDVVGATATRPSAPPAGDGEFFVLRARNACGEGAWGAGRSYPPCR